MNETHRKNIEFVLNGYYNKKKLLVYVKQQQTVLFMKPEKRAPKISPLPLPPYSIPFLSVLHQNKALYNFHNLAVFNSRMQYRSRICSVNFTLLALQKLGYLHI